MATCNTKVYMHLQRSLALHQRNLVSYVRMSLIYISSYSACWLFVYLPTMLTIDDLIDRKHYRINFYAATKGCILRGPAKDWYKEK